MQRKSDVVTLWLRRLFALLAVIVAFSGCAPSSTPPGPDVAGGKVEQGGFTFMRWKEGLAIMIWHNLESSTHHGSGSTTDPVYRLQGDAESQDGRHVDWRLETTDGKTAQFWIDNTPYDLSSGTLFIITTKNGRTEVRQLQRDLSGVQTNYESCIAFARSDPDLASFISDPAGAEPTTSPPGQVPSTGVHTPEDVQRYFDSWPEDYKLSIAEDVVVIFTFPDSTAQFVGGAVIYHIPSVSSAVLDFEGNLDSRNTHYESDEARARLETVLADADLMARLQTRINEIWGAYLNEDEGAAGPGDPLSEFQALLVRAVETHDFDLMQALMGDSFGLGGWRSEGWVYSPDEAIQQLRLNYLKADNDIRFQDAPDLSQQLGGRDILSVWDPAVNPVSALHSTGWASDGKAEAFLIVAQRSDGTFYWAGILIALGGFTGDVAQQPDPHSVLETDVKYVQVSPFLEALPIYSGPGGSYAQIGEIFGGMAATVTGVSADGQWWRVMCPDDTVGDCWISADPNMTEPTTPPGL